MFYWEPPSTAPAIDPIEAPSRAERAIRGVRTDVYSTGHEPAAWVWSDGAWHWASIRARHCYPDGSVELQVRVPQDSASLGERTYRWGPGIVLAHPGSRATSTTAVDTSRR
ncbi:hypothetical protein OG453_07585 [Streptomyces sp. NBC_01381]|uniref:hypothetical protein n=1 Tax=Streptomyces sp. NBC_01381 TaxID=2903845 RepID=UPI002252BD20|nr:hypothetical protein [Streptomyces sp. NBC_01381]MCX4666531.1 hypothetical protein [Streptomyces sp. NBC_01381]